MNLIRLCAFVSFCLCLALAGCRSEKPVNWNVINDLLVCDEVETKLTILKRQYDQVRQQQIKEPAVLLPVLEELASQVEAADWSDFHSKNNSINQHEQVLVRNGPAGGLATLHLQDARQRRAKLTSLQLGPRLDCARFCLNSGNKQAARDQLRKILVHHPQVIATPEFMVQAYQAYDPKDIEFQIDFRLATQVSARQPGVENLQYHIWWLDQVLTQPQDQTFKFEQSDFPPNK